MQTRGQGWDWELGWWTSYLKTTCSLPLPNRHALATKYRGIPASRYIIAEHFLTRTSLVDDGRLTSADRLYGQEVDTGDCGVGDTWHSAD